MAAKPVLIVPAWTLPLNKHSFSARQTVKIKPQVKELGRPSTAPSKENGDMAGTKKRAFPLDQVYGLLEPGPVVLVTTAQAGRANIMTLSWHTMMEFEPPIVGCVVSDHNYLTFWR